MNISKAIAAAAGGALTGTAGIPFMPENTPWYGYLAPYALTIGLPALLTLRRRTRSNDNGPALILKGRLFHRGIVLRGQGLG
ncbi:hypothetical protein ACVMB3_005687 [Sinorhizobium meliloti]|uniref:hypothetical protein n=1 Tax=Rhizobium meliloti TaxID=382 RepID=UPI0013E2BF43|nr:hypothetical protein [Sinorhizobium meliloti]